MNSLGLKPMEFWRMHPAEFWWLMEAKAQPKMFGSLTERDAAELYEITKRMG